MIGLLVAVDQQASRGSTPWHRASALTKLILGAGIVGVAIATPSLTLLVTVHVLGWALALSAGLPARLVLGAAAYPILFVALVIASRWDGTWATPLAVVLRPMTAGLVAAWLAGTTPYPDLFAPLSRLLPRQTGDALFLTYRACFSLIARTGRLRHAMRLRGGATGSARRRLMVAGEGLGTLIVHGFERSQRLYEAMLLRGHSGRICGCRHYARLSLADLWTGACAVGLAAAGFLFWKAP